MRPGLTGILAAVLLSIVALPGVPGTSPALLAFPGDSPVQTRAGARPALPDSGALDLVDLIREKKIEVETAGNGIQSVRVRIRRLKPLTVRVPVGTFFLSRNRSSQNMVATEEKVLTPSSTAWTTLSVPGQRG